MHLVNTLVFLLLHELILSLALSCLAIPCNTMPGCNGRGDGVDDTAMEAQPTRRCQDFDNPLEIDTCPSQPGNDNFDNFMNYGNNKCMYRFTTGQKVSI